VRLWSTANRELLVQFTEHTQAVTGLCIDQTEPNLLHSVSLDSTTVTMDVKRERRAGYHLLKGASFQSVSQRKDSETELVTGNGDGTIMFWDADEAAPVIVWQHPSKERISCVRVSPSGRFLASAGDDQNVTVWGARPPIFLCAGATPCMPHDSAAHQILLPAR
jgi:WD40 repeat protein